MNWKKIILYIGIAAIIMSIVIALYLFTTKDKVDIYYRTYTVKDGWTSWKKNGQECGNGDYITAIQVKVKSHIKGVVYYSIIDAKDELQQKSKKNGQTVGDKKNQIIAFNANFSEKLHKNFKISYQTYTNEKKWFIWNYDGNNVNQTDETGLIDYSIRKIKIKVEKR